MVNFAKNKELPMLISDPDEVKAFMSLGLPLVATYKTATEGFDLITTKHVTRDECAECIRLVIQTEDEPLYFGLIWDAYETMELAIYKKNQQTS